MSKTMAEVLAEHSNLEWSFEYGGFICAECGWQETYSRSYEQDAEAGAGVAHQAAALSAAGFGPVQEAQARAYDKGYGHGRHDGTYHPPFSGNPRPQKSRRNPYRKAGNDDQ